MEIEAKSNHNANVMYKFTHFCYFMKGTGKQWRIFSKSWFLVRPAESLMVYTAMSKIMINNWHIKSSAANEGTATESFNPLE